LAPVEQHCWYIISKSRDFSSMSLFFIAFASSCEMEAIFSASFLKLSSLSTYSIVKRGNNHSIKWTGKLHGCCYFQIKKKVLRKKQDLYDDFTSNLPLHQSTFHMSSSCFLMLTMDLLVSLPAQENHGECNIDQVTFKNCSILWKNSAEFSLVYSHQWTL